MKIRGIITTTVLILALITISTTTAAALSCGCGDICANETGWWRDGGAFNASAATPIQDAVDNAGSGDVIYVAAGSYTENVNITTSHLTLAGAGAGVVTVTAPSGGHGVEVTADYVNISGFTVTAIAIYGAAIYLNNADHCNISGNTASRNHDGIYLDSSSNNILSGNTASNNYVYGIYLDSSSNNTLASNIASGNGHGSIRLAYSSNNTLTGNTATHNYYGIHMSSSSNNALLNNTASNNDDGICVSSCNYNLFANNTASNNDYYGIGLFSSSNNTLTGNTAQKNCGGTGIGIWLTSSCKYNTLTGNTVSDNAYYGIGLWSSENNTLASNVASSNGCGIMMESSSNNTLIGNTVSNNRNSGIRMTSSSNNNTLANNTASNNRYSGIRMVSSSSNLVYNNYFNNTNNAYDSGNNQWNITKTNGTNIIGGPFLGGNYWGDYAGVDNDGDGLGDTMLPYNSSGEIPNRGDIHPLTEPAAPPATYIPPNPTNLRNTVGNYWVNYTWSAGAGNATDSYNMSLNGTWTNGTTNTFTNTSVGHSGWANITVLAYNASGTGTESAGSVSDAVQAPAAPPENYIPPNPTNLRNTVGSYWVNYTWSPGTGNVTDSYNVNLNGIRTNGTTDAFANISVGPGGWANITVFAYNASGTGTLSTGSVSDEVQAPAAPAQIVSYGESVYARKNVWFTRRALGEPDGQGALMSRNARMAIELEDVIPDCEEISIRVRKVGVRTPSFGVIVSSDGKTWTQIGSASCSSFAWTRHDFTGDWSDVKYIGIQKKPGTWWRPKLMGLDAVCAEGLS